jgi:hypothetical protein
VCVGGPPPNCDDGNVCTDDSCDPASGCLNTPNTVPCDDGDACTTNDTCSGGACVGGPPPNCDDGNGCTDDTCDPASGCVNDPNTAPCDDGDACTTNDTCSGGACVGGPAPNCDDGVGCTDDACDRAVGCVNTPNDANCLDDGLYCNGTEFCDPGNDCTSTGDPCPAGETCNEDSDICEGAPVVIDLDIARFRVKRRVRLSGRRDPTVSIKLVVRNGGTDDGQSRPAIVVGVQNGSEVYNETLAVSDPIGDGRSTFEFPSYRPEVAGNILWTVVINDDDPDGDSATRTTRVLP